MKPREAVPGGRVMRGREGAVEEGRRAHDGAFRHFREKYTSCVDMLFRGNIPSTFPFDALRASAAVHHDEKPLARIVVFVESRGVASGVDATRARRRRGSLSRWTTRTVTLRRNLGSTSTLAGRGRARTTFACSARSSDADF